VDKIKEAIEKSLGRPVDEKVWGVLQEEEYLDGSYSVGILLEEYKHYEKVAKRLTASSSAEGPVVGRVRRGKKRSGKSPRPDSLATVTCGLVHFSDYTIETLPEVKWQIGEKVHVYKDVDAVVGIPPVIVSANPKTVSGMPLDSIHETCLETDTLFEVLHLARNIDVLRGFSLETSKEISTSEVLDLCRKYGLLRFDVSGPVWMQHRKHGVLLNRGQGNLAYGLFALKWRFEVFMAVLSEQHDVVRDLVPDVWFRERFLKRGLSDEEALQVAKEWLCEGSTLRPITIFPTYDNQSDAFILTTSAPDILEACHVHLSLMLVGNGDLGRNLLVCQNPHCGRYFTGHGNAKYCPNCDRRTLWSRRKRNEERSAGNGKEARER